jgi:hypothetical protein
MRSRRLLSFGLALVLAAFAVHAQGRGGRGNPDQQTPAASPTRNWALAFLALLQEISCKK